MRCRMGLFRRWILGSKIHTRMRTRMCVFFDLGPGTEFGFGPGFGLGPEVGGGVGVGVGFWWIDGIDGIHGVYW